MKSAAKIIIILIVLTFASCTKPIEYYNMAITAGNIDPFMAMESKISRLNEGYGDDPSDLKGRSAVLVASQEPYIAKLKELLGNTDSDAMITASLALLANNIKVAKAEKTQELFVIVDNAQSIAQLGEDLAPLQAYYDEIYEKREALYKTYNEALTAYADSNDIEMKFIGVGIIPGANDKRKKP